MKWRFDCVRFNNRWKQTYWGDYTLIGITKWWIGPIQFSWRFCFIGLEMSVWFKKHES